MRCRSCAPKANRPPRGAGSASRDIDRTVASYHCIGTVIHRPPMAVLPSCRKPSRIQPRRRERGAPGREGYGPWGLRCGVVNRAAPAPAWGASRDGPSRDLGSRVGRRPAAVRSPLAAAHRTGASRSSSYAKLSWIEHAPGAVSGGVESGSAVSGGALSGSAIPGGAVSAGAISIGDLRSMARFGRHCVPRAPATSHTNLTRWHAPSRAAPSAPRCVGPRSSAALRPRTPPTQQSLVGAAGKRPRA